MKQQFIDQIPQELKDDLCLLGLQGSRGLGMAMTEDADYDYRGVFKKSNEELLGLDPNEKREDTIVFGEHGDDEAEYVFHEVGKFIKLCMKGNPSVISLLFLPKPNFKNNIGSMLLSNRDILIGSIAIREAFGGYAMAQARRLAKTGKFKHSRKRAKHIRHIFRLFDQGQELLETGFITFPLKDPQKYIDLGNTEDDQEILRLFEARDKEFKACRSILPEKPNNYLCNGLLIDIRFNIEN